MDASPYVIFSYSIRSPSTKETYFRRLRLFFDAIPISGSTFEDRCNLFVEMGQQDPSWAFNCILKYTLSQKEMIERKEITAGTLLYVITERKDRKERNYSRYVTQLCKGRQDILRNYRCHDSLEEDRKRTA